MRLDDWDLYVAFLPEGWPQLAAAQHLAFPVRQPLLQDPITTQLVVPHGGGETLLHRAQVHVRWNHLRDVVGGSRPFRMIRFSPSQVS